MTSKWESVAQTLIAEHQSGASFLPFAANAGIARVEDAYAVQREYVSHRQRRSGSRRAGYKIGLTSKAMQHMCSIDTPVSGVVFSDLVVPSPARLQRAKY